MLKQLCRLLYCQLILQLLSCRKSKTKQKQLLFHIDIFMTMNKHEIETIHGQRACDATEHV